MSKAERFAAYQNPAKYVESQEDFNALMANFIADFPIPVQAIKGAALNWIPKMAAEKAGRESHKNRPEQKAKRAIETRWNEWQEDPSLYPSLAEFARRMVLKHPAISTTRTVEDWGRQWKKTLGS